MFWEKAVNTDKGVTENRLDIIRKKEKTCILIGVAIPADRICNANGSGKETKIQEFVYRDVKNVES